MSVFTFRKQSKIRKYVGLILKEDDGLCKRTPVPAAKVTVFAAVVVAFEIDIDVRSPAFGKNVDNVEEAGKVYVKEFTVGVIDK